MTAVVRGWHEQHRAKARGVQGRATTPTPHPSHAQSGHWQGAEHSHGQGAQPCSTLFLKDASLSVALPPNLSAGEP